MGAVMLLSGVLVAISTSPILDRILIPKSGLTMCILCPLAAISWLILIWIGKEFLYSSIPLLWVDNLNHLITVKPHNTGALFPIFAVIGVCSITVIPVGIKVGAEITRNAEGSAFILWFMCAAPSLSHLNGRAGD
jgi:MFS transporter, FLVCR family, MFS-domain-containing protein 7